MTDPAPPPRPLDLLAEAVRTTVASTQHAALRQDSGLAPAARAALAHRRAALTRPPGSVPSVWEATIGSLPPSLLGRGDEPNAYERASHVAVTMHALHQQSNSQPAHVATVSLGRAVARLKAESPGAEGVQRRFLALVTAATFDELVHHLRGLITLLRGAQVGLDYGLLAQDLVRLQRPESAAAVRLRWGRDLHARRPEPAVSNTPSTAQPTPTNQE